MLELINEMGLEPFILAIVVTVFILTVYKTK